MKRESLATVFFFSLREWKGFLRFFLSFLLPPSLSLFLLPLSFSAHVSSESTGVYQFVHPRADPNVAIVSCRHICTMNITVLLKKREKNVTCDFFSWDKVLFPRWTMTISRRRRAYTSTLYIYRWINISVSRRETTHTYVHAHASNRTTKSMKTKPRYTGN